MPECLKPKIIESLNFTGSLKKKVYSFRYYPVFDRKSTIIHRIIKSKEKEILSLCCLIGWEYYSATVFYFLFRSPSHFLIDTGASVLLVLNRNHVKTGALSSCTLQDYGLTVLWVRIISGAGKKTIIPIYQ